MLKQQVQVALTIPHEITQLQHKNSVLGLTVVENPTINNDVSYPNDVHTG